MKRTKCIRCFSQRRLVRITLLVAAFALSCPSWAVEVIANAGVATQNLPVNVTRAIFGMRQLTWADGLRVKVFVLPDKHPLHNEFCKEKLSIYPYQLRQSWDRLIYSGTGQAPTEVATEEEMVARVANTPGAIGYVRKVHSNATHTILIR